MMFSQISAKTKENFEETLNKFVFEVVKEHIRLAPMKDIFMTFLLELNEDFDDDLLLDVIRMLE